MDNSPDSRSKFQGPRAALRGSGLLMLFGNQLLVLFEGVGGMVGLSAALGPRFYDGLAEAIIPMVIKAVMH